MTGLLCLQGGREFTADCVEMDRLVIERAGARTVAVLAGAARVGDDYDGASERARRHYAALGVDVVVLPDPRIDVGETVAAMDDAVDLVVLPGGSPSSLLDVLRGAVRDRLVEMYDTGTAISGASAGAMVLCSRMIRPERGGEPVDGLGLVEGLALPHWSPGTNRWNVPDVTLWGLPECGGIVFEADDRIAVGRGDPSVRLGGAWQPVLR